MIKHECEAICHQNKLTYLWNAAINHVNAYTKAKLFMKHYRVQCSTVNCKTIYIYSWLPGDGNASVGRRRQVGAGKDPTCKNDMLGDCSHVQIKFWLSMAKLTVTCMWFLNHGKHSWRSILQMSCWESTLSKRATDLKFLSKDPCCAYKFAGFLKSSRATIGILHVSCKPSLPNQRVIQLLPRWLELKQVKDMSRIPIENNACRQV